MGINVRKQGIILNICFMTLHACDQDGEVVVSTKYKLRTCEVVVTQIEFEIF